MNKTREHAGAFGRQYLETYYPSIFHAGDFIRALQALQVLREEQKINISRLRESTHLASEVIENAAILDFLMIVWIKCYQFFPSSGLCVVDIGGGPTVYQHILASLHAETIIHAEYLEENRKEVEIFLERQNESYDWSRYTQVVREMLSREEEYMTLLESFRQSPKENVRINAEKIRTVLTDRSGGLLEELVRTRIHSVVSCDIFNSSLNLSPTNNFTQTLKKVRPLGLAEIVSCYFVPESVATNKNDWEFSMGNIISKVAPNGYFIMMAIRNAEWYASGEVRIEAYPIDEVSIREYLLKKNFKIIELKVLIGSDKKTHGYDGMVFVFAQKVR